MDKQTVTKKQLEILLLLYRFRFLNRYHIQQFLNHKDPRRINAWLKDLTNRNIIGRKYFKTLKDNTKPAIYFLATGSRLILLDLPDTDEQLLKRVYREKTRSKKLIDHCLLVADIYFYLSRQIKSNDKLHFFTKVDLKSHYYLPYRRPDAYIALESKQVTKRYFLDIIDPETPRFVLRSKVASLIDYFDEKTWQQNTGHPNPSILLVCPDETIKGFLDRHIRQVLEEEAETDLNFFLTTKEEIENWQMAGGIWQKVEEDG